jgi:hypothetical protein
LQELSNRERKLIKARLLHFSTPGKLRPKKEEVAVIDALDEEVFRRFIHNFHVTQKQRPTLNTLIPLIRENINFKGGKTSLRLILKKLGSKYLKNTFIETNLHNFFLSENF